MSIDKVSDEKALRNKVGKEVWSQLQKNPFLMGTPDFLFADAILSFKNGAYTAAILGCRASLESAVYHAVTRDRSKGENKSALEIDFDYIHAEWPQLVTRAKEIHVLDPGTEARLEDVRKASNFAGRQGQQFDETVKKELAKGSLKGLTWVDFALAEKVLNDTVQALNSVRSNFDTKRNPLISLSTLRRKLGFVRNTTTLLIGAFLTEIIKFPVPWVTVYEIVVPSVAVLAISLKLYKKKRLYASFEAYAFKSIAWSIDQVAQFLLATAVTILLLVLNPGGLAIFGIVLILVAVLEYSASLFKGYPRVS
jgi:hypothetical protein